MKITLDAGIAALLAATALTATPALAQIHSGGFHGGGHMAGAFHAGGGFHGAASGSFHNRAIGGGRAPVGGGLHTTSISAGLIASSHTTPSTMRSGNWHDGDGDADDNGEDRDDFNVVFFDPGFGFWGDPFYWDGLGYFGGYTMAPDDNYRDSRAAAPPAGYDCDGWRWDAAAGRYVAAKVSCK